MSPSIIKTIDASLFPAALLVVSKVIGLYLVISLFNLEWQIEFANNTLFTAIPVVFERDLFLASTFSDGIMLLIMMGALALIVIRSVYFHSTHIDPKLVVQLVNLNLLGLIKDSYKIYSKASVWFIFNLVALVVVIINSIKGTTAFWLPLIGIILYGALLGILVKDIENEIEIGKKNLKF